MVDRRHNMLKILDQTLWVLHGSKEGRIDPDIPPFRPRPPLRKIQIDLSSKIIF